MKVGYIMIKFLKSKDNENIKKVVFIDENENKKVIAVYGKIAELVKENIIQQDGSTAENTDKILLIFVNNEKQIEFETLEAAKEYAKSLYTIKTVWMSLWKLRRNAVKRHGYKLNKQHSQNAESVDKMSIMKTGTIFTAKDKLNNVYQYQFVGINIKSITGCDYIILKNLTLNEETRVEAAWFSNREICQ